MAASENALFLLDADDPTGALVMGALRRAASTDAQALIAAREGNRFSSDLLEIHSGQVFWNGRVVIPVERVIDVLARRDVVKIERRRFDGQPALWGAVIGFAGGALTGAAILGRGTGPDTMAGLGALLGGALGSGIGVAAGSIAGSRGKVEVVYDVNALP